MSNNEGYTETGYYLQVLAEVRELKAANARMLKVLTKVNKTVMAFYKPDEDLNYKDQGSSYRDFEWGQFSGFTGLANDLALILLEKDNETN